MRIGGAIVGGQILGVITLAILLALLDILAGSALPTAVEQAADTKTVSGITRYLFALLTTGWALVCLVLAIGAPIALGAVWASGNKIAAGVFGMIILLIGIMLANVVFEYSEDAAEAVGATSTSAAYSQGSCTGTGDADADGDVICIGTTPITISATGVGADTSDQAKYVGSDQSGAFGTIKANAQIVYNDLVITRTVLQFVDVLYVVGLVGALFMSVSALGMAGVNAVRSGGGMGSRR